MARIGITIGDVAGIGPEIVVKAIPRVKDISSTLTIVGSASILSAVRIMLKGTSALPEVVDTGDVDFEYGQIGRYSGQAALKTINKACSMIKEGKIDALVTAPVNKRAVQLSAPGFAGHTGFLAREFDAGEVLMIAHSPYTSFAFVTTHLPVKQVTARITSDGVLAKIRIYADYLRTLHQREPRIAVLALNPHGSEFSAGEEVRIEQAVSQARDEGLDVGGPYPADTLHLHLQQMDGFLAQYHDQGMIPAKLLARGQGVNVTWGLGFVRTSPLHGTAFDIAGKGEADPSSMVAAIRMVDKLAEQV